MFGIGPVTMPATIRPIMGPATMPVTTAEREPQS